MNASNTPYDHKCLLMYCKNQIKFSFWKERKLDVLLYVVNIHLLSGVYINGLQQYTQFYLF